VYVDCFAIMPNHVHMTIRITEEARRPVTAYAADGAPSISQIVNQMKGEVTKKASVPIWCKSFHDRIIRNQNEYDRIWDYIHNNPKLWEKDRFYVHE